MTVRREPSRVPGLAQRGGPWLRAESLPAAFFQPRPGLSAGATVLVPLPSPVLPPPPGDVQQSSATTRSAGTGFHSPGDETETSLGGEAPAQTLRATEEQQSL